ncbi:MAG: hypothetical protein IPM45_07915 [Acidimicrobiales bacterium]|nr:hypothetical protein [Acidimicrobiales bacterium]
MPTALVLAAGVWLDALHVGIDFDGAVPEPTGAFVWVQGAAAVVWSAAAIILLRRPEIGWSLLSAGAALSHALAMAGFGWAVQSIAVDPALPGADVAVWLVSWTLPVEVIVLNWMVVTLPDARLPKGYLRWPAIFSVAAPVLAVGVTMVTELDVSGSDFGDRTNPLAGGLSIPGFVPFLLIAPTAVTCLWVAWVRWRRCSAETRAAMRAVVVFAAAGLAVPFVVGLGPGVGAAQVITSLLLLALIAVVLRHGVFGIDTVLERALAYSLLTGLLLVLYVALVALSDVLFERAVPAVVAVSVALAALPIRDVLSRATARFVFGDRDRPQDVVEAVARRAADPGPPEEMLSDVIEEIAARLRLDHVVVRTTGHREALARAGQQQPTPVHQIEGDVVHVDLTHRGRLVGVLEAGARRGEDQLHLADVQALERLAPQIAGVVDAAATTAALRASRDRVVQVREEERRRLRRDLHDGLGPGLTGIAFTIDAARNTISADPDRADELLATARGELTDALAEVRRVVDGLRPPALDDLGLAGSIRQHASRFPAISVVVQDDGTVGALPAAVEVAAYRIATEALTNTARHARAQNARVSLRTNGSFEVEVIDDGTTTTAWTPGVGLSSMRERAAEVGGTLTTGPLPQGGGRVLARFPVER